MTDEAPTPPTLEELGQEIATVDEVRLATIELDDARMALAGTGDVTGLCYLLQALREFRRQLAVVEQAAEQDIAGLAAYGQRVDMLGTIRVSPVKHTAWDGVSLLSDVARRVMDPDGTGALDIALVPELVATIVQVWAIDKPSTWARVTPVRELGLDPDDYREQTDTNRKTIRFV